MSTNSWNKKAVVTLTIATLFGVLSPISAVAENPGPSSVTYTVDLNEGGGGGVVCPTQTTFTVDPGAAQPTSLGVTEALDQDRNRQDLWYDDAGTQSPQHYNVDGLYPNQDDFNEWERNKKRSFAFTPMVVTFDADGCETSTLTAAVFPERGPVLRADTARDAFEVAEIRNNEQPGISGFGTASNVGMANLFANTQFNMGSNLNFDTPYWEEPIWNSGASLTDASSGGNQWPVAAGSDGEFTLQPRIDIFGNNPTGVYKVTYHLYLDVEDTGLSDNGCWWFCY